LGAMQGWVETGVTLARLELPVRALVALVRAVWAAARDAVGMVLKAPVGMPSLWPTWA